MNASLSARPRHPLWTKLLLAALVPLPLGIAAGIGASHLTGEILVHTHRLVHERETETVLHRLGSLALEAESNERGYLLTGNPAFLAAYGRAVQSFPAVARQLRDAVSPDAAQIQRVEAVEAVFRRWQAEVAEPLIADRTAAPPVLLSLLETLLSGAPDDRRGALLAVREAHRARLPALSAAADDLTSLERAAVADRDTFRRLQAHITSRVDGFHGKLQMDDLLERLEQIRREESLQAREQAAAAATATSQARLLAVLSPVLSFLLLVGASLIVSRRVVGSTRKLVRAAARMETGALHERAEIDSNDEISQVARAFNRMAARLEARDREAESLRRLSDLLQSCGSVNESLTVGVEMLERLLPGRAGAVYLFRGGTATRSTVFGGEPDAQCLSFDQTECWAVRRSGTHESSPSLPIRCGHGRAGAESSACVPLLANGVAVGLVHLEPGSGCGPLAPAELRLAETVAEQLAMAVANLSLRDLLREQAIRDPLTGLYNRRYLEESLGRELERARRRGGQFSVLVLDVDHFKRFNDTHGHDAGDAVLREVGAHLRGNFRGEDVCARLGGEEFAVVLTESALGGARDRAERLREALSRLSLEHEGRRVGSVTISVGVAHWPSHGGTPADVLRAADRAMYRAKSGGRNRVVVAGPDAVSEDDAAPEAGRDGAADGTYTQVPVQPVSFGQPAPHEGPVAPQPPALRVLGGGGL